MVCYGIFWSGQLKSSNEHNGTSCSIIKAVKHCHMLCFYN